MNAQIGTLVLFSRKWLDVSIKFIFSSVSHLNPKMTSHDPPTIFHYFSFFQGHHHCASLTMVLIQRITVFTLNISCIKSLSYDVHYSIFPNLHSVQLLSLKNVKFSSVFLRKVLINI